MEQAPAQPAAKTTTNVSKADRNAELLRRYENGESPEELAKEFGLAPESVYVIAQRARKRRKADRDAEAAREAERKAEEDRKRVEESAGAIAQHVRASFGNQDTIIGLPRADFSPEEILVIQDRLVEFPEAREQDCPSSLLRAINEYVFCELQFAKIAAQVKELELAGQYSGQIVGQLDAKRKSYFKMQKVAGDIIAEARRENAPSKKKRGRPPKERDEEQPEEGQMTLEETWVQVHRRYKEELDKMRAEGYSVGQPSQEEIQLAKGKFEHSVELEIKGAITDKARTAVIGGVEVELIG